MKKFILIAFALLIMVSLYGCNYMVNPPKVTYNGGLNGDFATDGNYNRRYNDNNPIFDGIPQVTSMS